MMVMADTNFLIGLVENKTNYRLFVQALENQHAKIGLPTPVLAEFVVKDDNMDRQLFLAQTNSFIYKYAFDEKSAYASAKIMKGLIQHGFFDQKHKDKQVIKVDIQILGITMANGVNKLFSTDQEIAKIILTLGLPIQLIDFSCDDGLSQLSLVF